jgi:flagellar biosynthetic protein FliS
MMNRTDMAYRKSAVEGASGFGLLIALYDTLAGNLRRAAAAQRAKDIETRCRETKHALMVIAYLEDGLQCGPGGALAQVLSRFYSALRRTVINAQINQSAEALEQQMEAVIKIREHWQKMDLRNLASGNAVVEAAGAMYAGGFPPPQAERRIGGWSA